MRCGWSARKWGGDLGADNAVFEGNGGNSLTLDGVRVKGCFFLRGAARFDGTLDLTAAEFGSLNDDRESWPDQGKLILDRCRYGAIVVGPVDAPSRLDWLSRQHPARWSADFLPQPYVQLARVLREMGHDADARAVLIEKERLQRRAARARRKWRVWRAALWVKDQALNVTIRYGRQPLLAGVWLLGFWLAGVGLFGVAEARGDFKPNAPVVLRAPEWTLCAVATPQRRFVPSLQKIATGLAAPGQTQLDCFRQQPEGRAYPAFNPFMYSLDTLLPVVAVGQEAHWIPDAASGAGRIAKAYLYVQILAGWALSLLAIAGFSGLVKSD